MFFVVRLKDSFNFPLGLIKYNVIVMTLNLKEADFFSSFLWLSVGWFLSPLRLKNKIKIHAFLCVCVHRAYSLHSGDEQITVKYDIL